MAIKQLELADFSPSSVDRIQFTCRNLFGIWSRASPRWFPPPSSVYYLPPEKDGEDVKVRTIDGRYPGFDWNILTKLAAFGLAEHRPVPHPELCVTPGLAINQFGIDFLMHGKIDLTKPVSAAGEECWADLQGMASESGSNLLHARNSLFSGSVVEAHLKAVRVGVASAPSGFMAVAYDGFGRRITDIFIEHVEHREALDRVDVETLLMMWSGYHRSPELRSLWSEIEQAMAWRLASAFGLSSHVVAYDQAVAEDIAMIDTSVFSGARLDWRDV
jgi:hypothetical protein